MGSTGEERRGSGSFEDCGSSEKPTRVLGVEEVLGVKLGGSVTIGDGGKNSGV